MDKTVDDFSPLVAYTAPSGNMRASESGGGFLVSVNLMSSFPVTSAHGIFNNRVSPSSPGGQPRAIAIVCIVWRGSTAHVHGEPSHTHAYFHVVSLACASYLRLL